MNPRVMTVLSVCMITLFYSVFAFANIEATLMNIQNRFIGTILPLMGVIGLIIAGLSFMLGSPNAKTHLVLAIVGTILGFAAPSLVQFIRTLVH